jgi:SpoVK/Ycf46/Vps4 family AAA+-type ATPase
MKKKNVINLIKYYSEENDAGFRNEAYEIARDFGASGDDQLAEYIVALMSNANTFVPQIDESQMSFFEKINSSNEPLPLPEPIEQDIIGIVHAIGRNSGIHKFLFQGAPGTGKTESAKQVARILDRELYAVNFAAVIDSKLGQTQKNISALFKELSSLHSPERIIILFDEIDALALDRTNSNDLREMGRATSSLLRELDRLDERIVLIATTNLFQYFDKALTRRFDFIIDFNRYTQEDLLEIAEKLLNTFLHKFKCSGRNVRLFRKIISLMNPIPYPGDLKNMIRTSIAFSDPSNEFDYLRRLYAEITGRHEMDLKSLQESGFTVREIELLTGISKSQVARELKEVENE